MSTEVFRHYMNIVETAAQPAGLEKSTEPQYQAALYVDEFGDGDHWYVKGSPDTIKRFVQLANSIEDEAVKGTDYEPGVGGMAKIHKQLGDDTVPNWKIVSADNLEKLEPIDNKTLAKLTQPNLSAGAQEFMSDFLWRLKSDGQAVVNGDSEKGVAEGLGGKVVFSGTGSNGSKYEIIQTSPYDFMIHANGKHIDTYQSLHRAMSVLKNEVPGLQQGVAEGSLDEIDRRGFLKGLGAAAVAGAAGGALAQSKPADISAELARMTKDDPRIQHNKDVNELARAIYERMVAERGQPMDRRQQQQWLAIARLKAEERFSQYAPGKPSTTKPSAGFPSQPSEYRRSRNLDNFESVDQGVAEDSKPTKQEYVKRIDKSKKDIEDMRKQGTFGPAGSLKDVEWVKKQGASKGVKSLSHYVAEAELASSQPVTGDYFAINIREETLFETWVCDQRPDGIVIYADDAGMQLLERYGYLGEPVLEHQHIDDFEADSDGGSVDVVDQGEYDYEGDQARDQLQSIVRAARRLNGIINDEDNLPEWVQMKITKAEDYIDTAADYMQSNREPDMAEAKYQGREVKLGKPFLTPGGPKKRSVYVRNPKTGNIKKVNFGDPNMRIKKSSPKHRKSFRARHNCANPGPRTSARYWSCRAW